MVESGCGKRWRNTRCIGRSHTLMFMMISVRSMSSVMYCNAGRFSSATPVAVGGRKRGESCYPWVPSETEGEKCTLQVVTAFPVRVMLQYYPSTRISSTGISSEGKKFYLSSSVGTPSKSITFSLPPAKIITFCARPPEKGNPLPHCPSQTGSNLHFGTVRVHNEQKQLAFKEDRAALT